MEKQSSLDFPGVPNANSKIFSCYTNTIQIVKKKSHAVCAKKNYCLLCNNIRNKLARTGLLRSSERKNSRLGEEESPKHHPYATTEETGTEMQLRRWEKPKERNAMR
jgi:hypothetical protein